jgi:integrase
LVTGRSFSITPDLSPAVHGCLCADGLPAGHARGRGIPKRDAQGRTVDVHSLRHTFATLLARGGVTPTVAQKLMRHSDIRLTMSTCTHLELADTAGAVAGLVGV